MAGNGFQFDIKLGTATAGLACAFAAYGQTQTSISGHVIEATGTPVAGVALSLIQLPSRSSPEPNAFHATSATDGFYLALAPSGSYRICVEEAQGYLDPCQWQLDASGTARTGIGTHDIVLQKGRSLVVHIVDPSGRLNAPPDAKVIAPSASVTITDSVGTTRLVPFRKTTGGIHEFSLLVPLASYTLNVTSSAATLAGADGAVLPAGGFSATVDVGTGPPIIVFSVVGNQE